VHIKNWTKLMTIILVIASATYLGASNVIAGEAVSALISACLGYVFGNGHGALEAGKECLTGGKK